jgi:AcrR family transcriptional regulator
MAAQGAKMLWISVAAGRYGGCLRFSRSRREKNRISGRSNGKTFGNKTLDKRLPRKPRADALRNRDRLLEAAKTVFSAGGPDASLEAVAKTAGVGIGTLYRHFPTREALFEAVYRHEVQQLADLAERLKKETRPIEALRQWLRSIVRFVATKKGMSTALALAIAKDSDLISDSSERLTRAIDLLLEQAIAAGEIRSDVSAEDLLRAIVGMCYTHDQPGWQKGVLRLVDVFVDGLRSQHSMRQTSSNKKHRVD